MSWKELFKPSVFKVAVFLVLIILSHLTLTKFVYVSNCYLLFGLICPERQSDRTVPWVWGCRECMTSQEYTESKIFNSYKLLIWPQLLSSYLEKNPAQTSLWYIFTFLIPAIYFYLVSCAILVLASRIIHHS